MPQPKIPNRPAPGNIHNEDLRRIAKESPMSRMQEALSHNDYDCATAAVPVAEPCEADTQERSDKRYHVKTVGESDCRQLWRSSMQRIVRNPPSRVDRPAAERTSRLGSPRAAGASAPRTCKRSESRSVSVPRQESVSGQLRLNDGESVAEQIRRFQERADLRECLLPGMLSKISRKACEGWQRQASVRTSRMLAKMKLEFCKRCQYGREPDPASV